MTAPHHPTARTIIAEITEALRERAAAHQADVDVCVDECRYDDAGACHTRARECSAIADFVAAYARFYPDNGEGQP
jgi:phenylpyruvate tautomerase PptA (4-oxalocrotonate tautomerase family)